MAAASRTMSSVMLKPAARSSRSSGVPITTTCGRPLYTRATGTSSATSAEACTGPSAPSRVNSRRTEASVYPSPTSGWSVTAIPAHGLGGNRLAAVLHEAPPEAPLDEEIALRDRVLERRQGLHDLLILHVQPERATDAAVGTDGVRRGLPRFVVRAARSHVELALRHEGTGRAHRDAIAAIDARRLGKRHGELGRDVRVEPTPRDGDRKRVLMIRAARLD